MERIAKRLFAKRSNRTANQTSQQREEKRKGLCLLPCAPPAGYFRAAFKPAVKETLSGAKRNSLTPLAIRLSSAAVVENYYVAHLACCLMQ